MNKIKVLHDVVKTLKKKEIINGEIKMEVIKGETRVISFRNEFYRNNESGETKAKINNEFNVDGNKIKNETEVEFNMKDCPGRRFHHHLHRHSVEQLGFKAKLSRAAFILNLLDNLKVEEKENKTFLSLDLKEVIKEGKEIHSDFQKNFSEVEAGEINRGPHHHREIIHQLLCSEYKDALLNIIVNKNNEVEKIEIYANGENIINGSININC